MLLKPETPFQSAGHKIYFERFLNSYLYMDSDRKPARIDLSQPEWTFSGAGWEQFCCC